jgi:phospholipid/cholesterol/gamma-HCH transport system substrate-binding protein
MKTFAERNLYKVGAVGLAVTAALVLASVEYEHLPFFDNGQAQYLAYFTESGGLEVGTPVQVSGANVGRVTDVELQGTQVLVKFNIADSIRLGSRTEAAIKTSSLLGAHVLQVLSRGEGRQNGPIPVDRTRPPYHLPDALGDLTTAISGLDTTQVSDSLAMLAQTFQRTPPELQIAVQGVARLSETLNERDAQLRSLLAEANKATSVLAQRSDQVVALVADANALLLQLETQRNALNGIAGHISAVAQQLKGFIADNRQSLRPALDKLNDALTIVDNRKKDLQVSIKKLNAYAMSLGESVSSGPFFQAYVVNLAPGQFVQPFIDAAFSDLGLDPNVLLPSQRTDPQVGQPATPPLPLPYPRTGQGGDPRLTLPDAITGKPDDPRYPYREPPPAPPPGGPPPGPPAPSPPAQQSGPASTAPGSVASPVPPISTPGGTP